MTDGPKAWIRTMQETNALRIYERKIVRKIYWPTRAGEGWRM